MKNEYLTAEEIAKICKPFIEKWWLRMVIASKEDTKKARETSVLAGSKSQPRARHTPNCVLQK